MREKSFRKAVCICFAVAIFLGPVKQISHASPPDASSEMLQEGESLAISDEQMGANDYVLAPGEEELRNEAEEPQEPGEGPDSPWHYGENQNQEEPSDEYIPEDEPGYEGNDSQEPSEEYIPEPGYEENEPGEPSGEFEPEAHPHLEEN